MNSLILLFSLFKLVTCDPVNEVESSEPPVKYCNNGLGECVKLYLCQNGTLNVEGDGLVNPRFSIDLEETDECGSFLLTCCDIPLDDLENTDHPRILPKRSENKVSNECGIRNIEGVGFHVTNTKLGEAQYGEFPWMVAILELKWQKDDLINFYLCGGSLIHPKVILTIAHCVYDRNYRQLIVRLGEWDTQTENEIYPHQDIKINKILEHPEFKSGPLHNDIALIYLQQEATLMSTVNTICLPGSTHFRPKYEHCFASGWGKDKFGASGQFRTILKSVELPVVSHDDCQTALRKTRLGRRFRLHRSMICAGGGDGIDTCVGDGGSPLVCRVPNTDDQYHQIGIVSWGIGCGRQDVPAAYTDVAYFDDWISEKIRDV